MSNALLAGVGRGLETFGKVGVAHAQKEADHKRQEKLAQVKANREQVLADLKHLRGQEAATLAHERGQQDIRLTSELRAPTTTDIEGPYGLGKTKKQWDPVTRTWIPLPTGGGGTAGGGTGTGGPAPAAGDVLKKPPPDGKVLGGSDNRGARQGEDAVPEAEVGTYNPNIEGVPRAKWKDKPQDAAAVKAAMPALPEGQQYVWHVTEGKFVPVDSAAMQTIVRLGGKVKRGEQLTADELHKLRVAQTVRDLQRGVLTEEMAMQRWGGGDPYQAGATERPEAASTTSIADVAGTGGGLVDGAVEAVGSAVDTARDAASKPESVVDDAREMLDTATSKIPEQVGALVDEAKDFFGNARDKIEGFVGGEEAPRPARDPETPDSTVGAQLSTPQPGAEPAAPLVGGNTYSSAPAPRAQVLPAPAASSAPAEGPPASERAEGIIRHQREGSQDNWVSAGASAVGKAVKDALSIEPPEHALERARNARSVPEAAASLNERVANAQARIKTRAAVRERLAFWSQRLHAGTEPLERGLALRELKALEKNPNIDSALKAEIDELIGEHFAEAPHGF